MLYGFELGREFKLSLAEIFSVFSEGKKFFLDKKILVLEILEENFLEKIKFLGGTIKVFELEKLENKDEFFEKILLEAEKKDKKFIYSINTYTKKISLQKFLIKAKKILKQNNISSRFANKTDKNLTSAQILGNNLLEKGADFNILEIENNFYFGKTIWVQDINAYSKRDFGKTRDMQIGMLPVKLAQIMINLGKTPPQPSPLKERGQISFNSLYDPFVGLGTILIEAKLMGFEKIFGSDLNEKMVEIARKNSGGKIEKLNAKFVNEVSFWDEVKDGLIVTEGYLGEIMTKNNISIDRINKQKKSLLRIFLGFFESLKKGKFSGIIIISFPFWEINRKYFYFDDIYKILEEYCEVLPLLKNNIEFNTTKVGSLLYKRDSQLVGREIFKLKIK